MCSLYKELPVVQQCSPQCQPLRAVLFPSKELPRVWFPQLACLCPKAAVTLQWWCFGLPRPAYVCDPMNTIQEGGELMVSTISKAPLAPGMHSQPPPLFSRCLQPERRCPAVVASLDTCTPIWPQSTSVPGEWRAGTAPSPRSPSSPCPTTVGTKPFRWEMNHSGWMHHGWTIDMNWPHCQFPSMVENVSLMWISMHINEIYDIGLYCAVSPFIGMNHEWADWFEGG